jgi:hypothetical protein
VVSSTTIVDIVVVVAARTEPVPRFSRRRECGWGREASAGQRVQRGEPEPGAKGALTAAPHHMAWVEAWQLSWCRYRLTKCVIVIAKAVISFVASASTVAGGGMFLVVLVCATTLYNVGVIFK